MVLVSIVVPTYKEAGNIPLLTERLDAAFKQSSLDYQVIFVDDNSADGSEQSVAKLSLKYPVEMHVRKNERGLSSAVVKGFELAQGDIYLCMDADLSHPPEKAVEMCEKISNQGADFVIGSRNISGGSADTFNIYRRLNAFVSRMLATPLVRVTDPMAGFFAFPASSYTPELVKQLNPIGWKICLEVVVKMAPKKMTEIPIIFGERIYGESKLSLKEQFNYIMHLKRLYYYKFRTFARFIVFSFVGATGMVVDLGTVFLLKDLVGLEFKFARIIGITLAMSSNFILNKLITFEERPMHKVLLAYIGFVAVCSVGALLNWVLSLYLVQSLTIHYLLASFFGILIGTVVNFAGSTLLVFRKGHDQR